MAGKRRSIADVDKDIEAIKESQKAIADAVGQLVNIANAEPEKSAAQIAHDAEFGDVLKQEKPEIIHIDDKAMPEIKVKAHVYDWYESLAKSHGRTLENELQYMIKKTYISGKASTEAELSRKQTVSGDDV